MPVKTSELTTKKIKLNFIFPENLETKFVNHVVVQHQKDFFTLAFFETVLPLVIGASEEERKAEFDKIDSIDAKCLARLIITPEKMNELVTALQENKDNRLKMVESEKKQDKEKT
jgi:hypothetical protein